MRKLIARDPGWVTFYRDNIDDLDIPSAKLRENEKEQAALEEAGKNEVRFMTKLWDNDIDGAQRELGSVIKDVAVFDPMLAGWYSMWTGMAYYASGKSDAALDMFDEARRRIGHKLPLPRRPFAEQERAGPSVTVVEEAIRQIANHDLVRVNDRIAKLRIQTSDAFSKTASHKQCEEAVRAVGSALGFVSSRPCTDVGKGPDNLWIDPSRREVIAFELKTEKAADSYLTKDEVGQGLNHIEWVKSQYPDLKLVGLIFMTDCIRVSDKANPSMNMHFGTQDQLRKLWDDFFILIDRIKTKSPIEKFVEANKIGELQEWNPLGIYERLSGNSCG
jgi:hypothetical protein